MEEKNLLKQIPENAAGFMKLQDYVFLASNNFTSRKLRSLLTILGIIIGIAAVVGLVSLGEGFQKSIKDQLSAFGGNSVFISPGKEQAGGFGFVFGSRFSDKPVEGELTTEDTSIIKGVRGLESIDDVITKKAEVSFRAEKTSLNIQGAGTHLWKIFNIVSIEQGRFFSSSERRVAVVGNTAATKLFDSKMKIGDIVEIDGTGFRVVGILEGGSGVAAAIVDNSIVIPKEDARSLFLESGSREVSAIIAKASENADMERITKDTEDRLRAFHKKPVGKEDFTVTSSHAIQNQVSNILGSMTIFLAGIAGISLLVGAIGISNTMFMSVMERTKQIGILKALGTKNKDVMKIFILESSILGLVGGLIGIFLGAGFGFVLSVFTAGRGAGGPFGGGASLTPVITPELIIFAIVFSCLIGAISGFLPARRAARLDPVEALRYE